MDYGQQCAETGHCYNRLRPIGSSLWFSVPFRLGLSASVTLITLHLLLAAISIALSVMAMRNLFQISKKNIPYQTAIGLCLFVISAVAHGLFLCPTIQLPLTDTPANLFALIAIWLMLIQVGHRRQFTLMLLAGLCLGFAAWLRVAFLYPLLLMLLAWMTQWLFSKQRNLSELGLLSALLPIVIQFHATWEHTGAISYLDPNTTEKLMHEHRDNSAIGYDTVMGYPWKWYPECAHYQPLVEAINSHDIYSLGCLLYGRVNFYLGSYSASTYIIFDANETATSNARGRKDKIRRWSHVLLAANGLVLIIATALLGNKIIKQTAFPYSLVFVFLILVCGQAIISLPEQRFAITPLIAAWVLGLSWMITKNANAR